MAYTLDNFAEDCRRILEKDPGPAGRKAVCALVEEALRDDAFVERHLGDDVPERKVLYEDKELGFCILAHVYKGVKQSQPHDHAGTWAIYGQARGETLMSDWTLVEPATDGRPGKVRHARAYKLTPGEAHLYNETDLHSPARQGPTKLIRIEGRNLGGVKRPEYVPV
jgi:predicted metal-dependent enzyme (double-stranded beta helix superfamily)